MHEMCVYVCELSWVAAPQVELEKMELERSKRVRDRITNSLAHSHHSVARAATESRQVSSTHSAAATAFAATQMPRS